MSLEGAQALEVHDVLPSTNDRCREWAAQGAAPFSVVMAREQSRGRGRNGKHWVSGRDAGLWISVLLPAPKQGPAGSTSILAGVCLALALEELCGHQVGLKWPNDLFLPRSESGGMRGDRRKGMAGAIQGTTLDPLPDAPVVGDWGKVAGVLCEVPRVQGAERIVAGFGVNLRPSSDPKWNPPVQATVLKDLTGARVDTMAVARHLLAQLRRWADPPEHPLTPFIQRAWQERDILADRLIELDDGSRGWARGVGPDGSLKLEDEDGKVRGVHGGSIRLPPLGVAGPAAQEEAGKMKGEV